MKKGFTAIELLVVIAIIGLIASIILVSTRGTREKAKIAKGLEFSASILNGLGAEAVGIWSFNENAFGTCSGGKDVCDASGYGNNGKILNGEGNEFTDETPHKIIGQGSGKYALSFDGLDDRVDITNANTLDFTNASNITMEAWCKPSGTGNTRMMGNNIAFTFRWDNQRFGGGVHIDGIWREYDSPDTSSVGKWHHVVTTYSESTRTVKTYVDGIEKVSVILSGLTTYKITGGDNTMSIGSWDGGGWNFPGRIDEVRIYRQALTQAQIQKHYAASVRNHKDF